MALPITTFSIVEVAKPNIGEKQPSRVRADVSVNLSVKDNVKMEWENLRRHDVCFLITIRPPLSSASRNTDYSEDFVNVAGLVYVRGCEVQGKYNIFSNYVRADRSYVNLTIFLLLSHFDNRWRCDRFSNKCY